MASSQILRFFLNFDSNIKCQITGLKFVNLEYNTLISWADGTKESSTKHLMFQVLSFFKKSCKILCKTLFICLFIFYIKFQKSFECPKSIRNNEKKLLGTSSTAWSTIRLSHGPSKPLYYILDWRISKHYHSRKTAQERALAPFFGM